MKEKIKRVLFDEETIARKVEELADKIDKDYPEGELLIVGVLKGASIFVSDLVRKISRPVLLDFIAASSYGMSSVSSGAVRIIKDLDYPIEGKHVVIVEDIIDTGLTLSYLIDNLASRKPKSIEICTFLDKPARRKIEVPVKYIGFQVPDEFIVGYGIDYAENYRNLPMVCTLDL